jgi:hypothetical protein
MDNRLCHAHGFVRPWRILVGPRFAHVIATSFFKDRHSGRRPHGPSAGLALAQRGHAIDLYDAHGPQGDGAAARVAAAMLAPLAESAITEPGVVRMGQHALKRWPELIAS